MSDATVQETNRTAQNPPDVASSRVFLRLVRLLRPYWPLIGLGLALLLLSIPCELFPAIVWRFVTDDVVLGQDRSPRLRQWFSLHGRIRARSALLVASVAWL